MNTKKKTEMWTMVGAVAMIAALLAVAAFAQGAAFRFFGPLSRIITPNGDAGKNNGTAFFCFDNPAGSGVTGDIFTLLGSEVATLGPVNQNVAGVSGTSCPAGVFLNSGQNLTWDGRSNGVVVRSGIYVYRIRAEEKSYTGTLLVVR